MTGAELVAEWEQGRTLEHAGALHGIEWISHSEREARLRWQPRERDTMPRPGGRIVHGGMLAFFADNAMGSAALLTCGDDERFATSDLHVQMLRPAAAGMLTCVARVTRRTRQIAFCEADVEDADGRIAVRARATNVIIPFAGYPSAGERRPPPA